MRRSWTTDDTLHDDVFASEIERIVMSADVPPRADLVDRVLDRVDEQPVTSAPRRFLVAVAALDLMGIVRGFRQTVTAAFGGSRIPAVVRYQAIAVVLLVVSVAGSAGVLGAAATLSIAELVTPPGRGSDQGKVTVDSTDRNRPVHPSKGARQPARSTQRAAGEAGESRRKASRSGAGERSAIIPGAGSAGLKASLDDSRPKDPANDPDKPPKAHKSDKPAKADKPAKGAQPAKPDKSKKPGGAGKSATSKPGKG